MKEASHSITVSERLKKVLEIILALGNFMNSQRKGLAVGFKIQSLSKVRFVFVHFFFIPSILVLKIGPLLYSLKYKFIKANKP